jgi:uncharacterized protein YceK
MLIIGPVITTDVCTSHVCQCDASSKIVHCDTKGWKDLTEIDFPSSVVTLTLISNNLKLDASKNY